MINLYYEIILVILLNQLPVGATYQTLILCFRHKFVLFYFRFNLLHKVSIFQASQTVKSLNVTERFSSNYAHVCGRRALDHEEVVSVRTDAKAGDWPWHVAIFIRNNNNKGLNYFCGGNIVSRTAIITGNNFII